MIGTDAEIRELYPEVPYKVLSSWMKFGAQEYNEVVDRMLAKVALYEEHLLRLSASEGDDYPVVEFGIEHLEQLRARFDLAISVRSEYVTDAVDVPIGKVYLNEEAFQRSQKAYAAKQIVDRIAEIRRLTCQEPGREEEFAERQKVEIDKLKSQLSYQDIKDVKLLNRTRRVKK